MKELRIEQRPVGLMPAPTLWVQMTSSANHVALPDVRCDLVWVREQLFLSGPQSRCQSHFPGQEVVLASIEPLAARAWLNIPLSELTDVILPLEDLNRAIAGPLSDAFSRMDLGAATRVDFRNAGWSPDPRLAAAVSRLRKGASIARAAAGSSLTPRHLTRLFHHQLGLRPKEFARIVRFRRAAILIKRGAAMAAAAAAAGFADQSHFTREARAFAGCAPTSLLPRVANVQDGVGGSPED